MFYNFNYDILDDYEKSMFYLENVCSDLQPIFNGDVYFFILNIYFEKWIRYNDNINNGMFNNPFEILSKTKINDAYHEYVQEGAKYVIVVIWNMYDLV